MCTVFVNKHSFVWHRITSTYYKECIQKLMFVSLFPNCTQCTTLSNLCFVAVEAHSCIDKTTIYSISDQEHKHPTFESSLTVVTLIRLRNLVINGVCGLCHLFSRGVWVSVVVAVWRGIYVAHTTWPYKCLLCSINISLYAWLPCSSCLMCALSWSLNEYTVQACVAYQVSCTDNYSNFTAIAHPLCTYCMCNRNCHQ